MGRADNLAGLEPNWNKRLKYIDFMDRYAQLSETERRCYQDEYLANSAQREVVMGLLNYSRQENRQEGLSHGIPQGEALLLKRQLIRRFGTLPDWVEVELAEAGPAQLELWGKRVLNARTLDEVFGSA